MATGPWELLEPGEECPDSMKELPAQKEDIQNQLNEDNEEDSKVPASQEEVNGTPNEIEKEEKNTFHFVEKHFDEFVDSMAEATPPEFPQKSSEAEKYPLPEMLPMKLPRAEQVAEKVLRAEKVVERASRVEKPPVLEKVAEKVPQVEKGARTEKTAEKPRPTAASGAPRTAPMRRKTEGRAAGSAKDILPWEGLTLNKCILVASFLALFSVSCQVVQEIIDFGGTILEAELNTWTSKEGSAGEVEEKWFYERWFDFSDLDEPLEIEEEELLEEEEELLEVEEEELLETEEEEEGETEAVETEEEEVEDEEEEQEEEPATKVSSKQSQEKARREMLTRERGRKGRKEEDQGQKHPRDRRPGWEGKRKEMQQQEDRKTHHHKHVEAVAHPSKEYKREAHDERKEERSKGKGQPKHERDLKFHPQKAWQIQKASLSPHKDHAHHKLQGWKRHD